MGEAKKKRKRRKKKHRIFAGVLTPLTFV